jgi:hypothetical protein
LGDRYSHSDSQVSEYGPRAITSSTRFRMSGCVARCFSVMCPSSLKVISVGDAPYLPPKRQLLFTSDACLVEVLIRHANRIF